MHIYVGAGGQNEDGELAARRTAKAHELLANYGVTARREPPPAEPGSTLHSRPSGADRAVILAGRFDVEVIGCPDWRKPLLDDFSNYESSNFGCANANNLALMVADPMDLVRGREGGTGDGTRAAGTIRGYRSGALPDLGDEGAAFVSIPSAAGGGS
jgi:pilus assembly protein CpaD